MGKLYESMNNCGEAEPLLQKALMIKKEVLSEKHPSTATSYSNLGSLYETLNDYSKAEPLLLKSLAIRKEVLGKNHPDTAQSYNNLGGLYVSAGNYGKAEPLFQKALAIRKKVQGENHPSTLMSYYNLGGTYLAMGKLAPALNIFKKTNTPAGEGHCYLARGDYKGALSQFEKSLAYLGESGQKELIIADHIGLGLSYEGLGSRASKASLEEAKTSLTRVRNEYERFIIEIKLKNLEVASLITTVKVDVKKIQKFFGPSAAILEYFTTKDKTYAWIITRDRITVHELPAGQREILDLVNNLLVPNISNKSKKPSPKMGKEVGSQLD